MDKLLVILGIAAMLIGIGFGIIELINLQPKGGFYMGAVLWTIGGITMILGLTIFSKEKWYHSIR